MGPTSPVQSPLPRDRLVRGEAMDSLHLSFSRCDSTIPEGAVAIYHRSDRDRTLAERRDTIKLCVLREIVYVCVSE